MAGKRGQRNLFEVMKRGSRDYERKMELGKQTIHEHVKYVPCAKAWPTGPSPPEATRLMQKIEEDVVPLLAPDKVGMANGEVKDIDSRRVAFLALKDGAAKSYYYAKQDHSGHDASPAVRAGLQTLLQYWRNTPRLAKYLPRTEFTNFQLNQYNVDGRLGWHADDEPEMDKTEPIMSVSLGSTRRFQMRVWVEETAAGQLRILPVKNAKQVVRYAGKRAKGRRPPVVVTREFELHHGDVIIMRPGCQVLCQHCVAPVRKEEARKLADDIYGGIRYNITMRKFHDEYKNAVQKR